MFRLWLYGRTDMSGPRKSGNVDYRLLGMLSKLVICSRCLRDGRVTPVPQVLSKHHTPRSLCGDCARPGRGSIRKRLSRLVSV